MSKRLEAGDRILVKPCLFYPYTGTIKRVQRFINLQVEEASIIREVIVIDDPNSMYQGRHLIVELSVGVIDIWTAQDQFFYRRIV
jgi:hypothetical protein